LTTVIIALVSSGAYDLPEITGGGYYAGALAILCIMLLACIGVPCGGPRSKKRNCHKIFPFNYIILLLFTLSIAYLLCLLVLKTESICILQAACMTTAMVIGLSSFAVIHKRTFDLTSFTPYLYISGFVATVQAILFFTFKSTSEDGLSVSNDLTILYCYVGVILFSVYLMYDIQLMIGGKSPLYKFSLESYVLGALALYVDIINIFAMLLTLFSADN
jgi:FtsH-binding integral membrane protein